MNDIGLRRRRALRWILVLAAVALLAVGATQPWGVSAVPLELAPSALHFRRILLDDWAAGVAAADITGFQRLRANLLADSLLLVPAYVALLVFFTLAYGPSPQRHPALRQWLCVPAVVAGLFDIAENSMTGRALDELMHSSLSDATVADIHLASRLKWILLDIALLIVAWRCRAVVRGGWHTAAAAACALGGLAMAAGAWSALMPAIHLGVGGVLAGLGLLAWLALRAPA